MTEPLSNSSFLDRALEVARAAAVAWLLVIGLWSGPSFGATLAYPNCLLEVEIVLLLALILLSIRGKVIAVRSYPFLSFCLAALALAALAASTRMLVGQWEENASFDYLCLWRTGEPMARALLIYLAIAAQPRLTRLTWVSMLMGLALPVIACMVQHTTGVSRWYNDLDVGWASGFTLDMGPRAQGLTSYINLTAAMLASALACWWVPLIDRIPIKQDARLSLLLGGVATTAALWYTQSRGPIVAVMACACLLIWIIAPSWGVWAIAAILAFLIAFWPAQPLLALGMCLAAELLALFIKYRHSRIFIPLALSLAIAGGIQVVDAYLLQLPLGWRLVNQGVTDQSRVEINRLCIHAIETQPLLGIGDEQLGMELIRLPYPGLSELPHVQRNGHNQYLQWAAAEGLPVALAYTLLVCFAVLWCWRRANDRRASSRYLRAIRLSLACALTVFLLTNLTDAHFWRIEGGGFFWSLLALAAGLSEKDGLK